eukprot:622557_1
MTEYFANYTNNQLTPSMTKEQFQFVLNDCTSNDLDTGCMGHLGIPTFPNTVFGGYNLSVNDYFNSETLISIFRLDNHNGIGAFVEAYESKVLIINAYRNHGDDNVV